MFRNNTAVWSRDELKLIDFMEKNPKYLEAKYKSKADTDEMWFRIAKSINVPINVCRTKWYRIKKRYQSLLAKKDKPTRTKYLDGRLSFLNKYYMNNTLSVLQQDVVVIDSDEEINEKDLYTIDLKMIEDLLALREPQEDIEISRRDQILALVSKRIDEALASHQVNTRLKEPEASSLPGSTQTSMRFAKVQDDLTLASESQSPQANNTDDESNLLDAHLQQAVSAFSNPSPVGNSSRIPVASMSIPMTEKPQEEEDDMETIFDIHGSSDSKTFYKELGRYVERFSADKQEEIRLKICCLVTEIELEEVGD